MWWVQFESTQAASQGEGEIRIVYVAALLIYAQRREEKTHNVTMVIRDFQATDLCFNGRHLNLKI